MNERARCHWSDLQGINEKGARIVSGVGAVLVQQEDIETVAEMGGDPILDLVAAPTMYRDSVPIYRIGRIIPFFPEEENKEERPVTNRVFIVHGHDDPLKLEVSNFLRKLGLEPVILHEQVNAGSTIIEKFTANSDVSFAVILLTPDDFVTPEPRISHGGLGGGGGFGGGGSGEAPRTSRARQNVIFEWGYFVAKLGRDRVVALKKGDIELPSDMHGIIWVAVDDAGAWHFRVGKEMRHAGLEVDLNNL